MADREDWKNDDEDEADEETNENDYKTQKDAILLAIEVSDSMLKRPPPSDAKKADTDSAVQAALKCAYQLMEQRIISSPRDMMGILFFGTDKSKFQEDGSRGGLGYPHCYLFIDLDIPAADDVKTLKSLVEEGEDRDCILTPSQEKVQMANVFFCANQIFTTKAANFGSRRLFIITDNADPHPSDKAAKSAAAVRAKDLYDLGVTIELFPITRDDEVFDLTKFYDDITYRDTAGEANLREVRASKSGDGLTLLASLISNVSSKQTPKRALFSNVPLEISPTLKISVKGYNVLHRQTPARTCYIWLDGDKPQIAMGETTRLAEDSARTVERSEIKRAYKFGGEFVYFSPEEQKAIKDFGSPVIRIIGFKSRTLIPFWASIKKSTFIFPSEEDYVGSTRVFAALWHKLLASEKVAIAWCITRKNMNPILVAIFPSKESSEDENGTPYLPAGLWLYPLPFADDLRDGPATDGKELVRPSNDLIDDMRTVVQQLQLPKAMYNPTRYPNPSLQWHYKILQALALEEEVPEDPEDATQPKFKAIKKRAGGYMQEWDNKLKQEATTVMQTNKFKREAEDDAEDVRSAKKTKTSSTAKPSASGLSNAQLRASADSGDLKKMTVADLKDLLGSRGQSTSGKKADLLERLEQWLDSNS